MAGLSRAAVFGLGTALLIGVGAPVLDVLYKCQQSRARIEAACGPLGTSSQAECPVPTSEACVWGKSLLPVSIAASLVLLGLPAGAVVSWAAARRFRQ